MGASMCCCCATNTNGGNTIEPIRYKANDDTENVRMQPKSTHNNNNNNSSRHYLIFINPHSGKGQSLTVFKRKVEPLLIAANISYELFVTEYPNHARADIRNRDLSGATAIIILSGDGLVFEIINGMLDRSDRDSALHTPIGIIPSGSGNGLIASIFHHCKMEIDRKNFIRKSAEMIVSPNTIALPINLVHIETPNEHMAGFLSVGWGLISDVDIESERCRHTLGPTRFVIGALIRCLDLRSYKGRLWYLPYADGAESSSNNNNANADAQRAIRNSIEQQIMTTNQQQQSPIDDDKPSSSSPIDDDTWHSRKYANVVGSGDGNWFPSLAEVPPTTTADGTQQWTYIEDEFVLVHAVMSSYLATDAPYMPSAALNDDRIYLTYIRRDDLHRRHALIRWFLGLESAKHLDFDFFKVIPVRAFRLDPIDTGSYITVDGEIIECDRIQATVTGYTANVLAAK